MPLSRGEWLMLVAVNLFYVAGDIRHRRSAAAHAGMLRLAWPDTMLGSFTSCADCTSLATAPQNDL
jgi:hypothetical protein